VAIIGAGLAGLCLAHSLRRHGWDVSVYERDPGPVARGQGYRIHIAAEGEQALASCLPQDLYQLAVATSGKPGSGVTVLNSDLEVMQRTVFRSPGNEPASVDEREPIGLSVDRLTLRQILLAGLDGAITFDAAFTDFERRPDGGVRVRFGDGRTIETDLLVAADGCGSLVRRQLLPQAVVVETGIQLIFGKTPLTGEVRSLAPAEALDGFSTIVGSESRFMPLAGFEYRVDPNRAGEGIHPKLVFQDTRDYVMWVFGAPKRTLSKLEPDGIHLRDLVLDRIADWHPHISELVSRCDTETVHSLPMRTSSPVRPWETGPVTLMGDAIHCMIPAGIGAAVALRDAELLALRLAEAQEGGPSSLTRAVHDYEREMLDYGFAAVSASQRVGQRFT
jgi:2-polyprenyl-6-methoxyphenol hydroxylase-like FAD-dependent oxidoreductase